MKELSPKRRPSKSSVKSRNQDLLSILHVASTGSAMNYPSARGKEVEKGALGGLATWEALAGKCATFTKETRRARKEEPGTAKMKQG